MGFLFLHAQNTGFAFHIPPEKDFCFAVSSLGRTCRKPLPPSVGNCGDPEARSKASTCPHSTSPPTPLPGGHLVALGPNNGKRTRAIASSSSRDKATQQCNSFHPTGYDNVGIVLNRIVSIVRPDCRRERPKTCLYSTCLPQRQRE